MPRHEQSDAGTVPGSPRAVHFTKVGFGNYDVVVILGPSNEFVGISEISLSKSFLSEEQEAGSSSSYDISDLYQDE